jgi:hypothetical protein
MKESTSNVAAGTVQYAAFAEELYITSAVPVSGDGLTRFNIASMWLRRAKNPTNATLTSVLKCLYSMGMRVADRRHRTKGENSGAGYWFWVRGRRRCRT